jgi:ribonuclease J
MRLRIHHGAEQVGGNCIELEYDGERILLDLGLPLDSAPQMPEVQGLTTGEPSLLGVVLSHPHLDHYGLLPAARPNLPVWLGAGAIRLLEIAAPFAPAGAVPQAMTGYRDRQSFTLGPFRITPYLMDHSAYDAHALLVEAGGKRVLYSGDFRGHGRKAPVFERFLANPPADVDLLLMEGTTLSRADGPSLSEAEVETEAAAIMGQTPGPVLACFSAQNIDRFVSFYRASVRAGRTFVMDAYLANLIRGLELRSLPNPTTDPRSRVFLPATQKRMIMASSRFDLIEPFRARRIFRDELAAHPDRFAMMFRASMTGDLNGLDLAGGSLIYSLWPGYLERDRTDLREWAREHGLAFHLIHGSGHASPNDLRRMAAAVRPKRLMPIHSAVPARYGELYPAIERAGNGAWVRV